MFGTSANPPTGDGGHTGIVRSLSQMEELNFDEIRVLPVYRHTFSSKRDSLASYEDRLEMCRLSFQNIPRVSVSDAERRSYLRSIKQDMTEEEIQELRVGTADLLEMLIQEEADTDFTFCLGADTFMDLTAWKWRRSKDIFRLLNGRLVVLHRKGMTKNDELHERFRIVNEQEGKGNVVLLNVPSLQEVSSSFVRSCSEEYILSRHVSPQVLEYMRNKKLYSFAGNLS